MQLTPTTFMEHHPPRPQNQAVNKRGKKSRSDLCSTEEELQCLDLEEDMPHLLEEEGVTEPTNYTK
jgi:hypothetical protein